MKVDVLLEAGYEEALYGLSLSFKDRAIPRDVWWTKAKFEAMQKRASALYKLDGGHNKFLESMLVWLDVEAPRGWWSEMDTYRLATKQSECFDEKTEILTNNGWKFFSDLEKEDKVCTMLPHSGEIVYQKPVKYINDSYVGEVIRFKSNKFDLLVTPNHNMVIWTDKNKLDFVKASDFKYHMCIPKNVHSWYGTRVEKFKLPEVTSKWTTGFGEVTKHYPELTIDMDDWLAFLGIWLSEGRTVKVARSYNTYIYQNTDSICYDRLCSLFDRLPFKAHKSVKDGKCCWTVSNLQLYNYLIQLGNTYNKYIPRDYFELCGDQLQIFLEWLMLGDGTDNYEENYTYLYSTVSKQLADDVQELFLKTGNVANIYERVDNRKASYKILYTVNRSKTLTYRIQEENITKEHYEGNIYCVEVPNHTLFVRRNGKATWSGNSSMHSIQLRPTTEADYENGICMDIVKSFNKILAEETNNFSSKAMLSGRSLQRVKDNLPEGFLQRRVVCMSYKTLKNIVVQRKAHKLIYWQIFIDELKAGLAHPEFLEV